MNGFHKIEGGIFPYIYLIFKKLLKFYLLSMLCQEINLLENLRVKIFLLNSIQKKKKPSRSRSLYPTPSHTRTILTALLEKMCKGSVSACQDQQSTSHIYQLAKYSHLGQRTQANKRGSVYSVHWKKERATQFAT